MDSSRIGIYRIISPSGKCYVGMTMDSFSNRWRGHIKELRSGKHKCSGLRNAYSKYGEESLKFEILESMSDTIDQTIVLLKEQEWWDRLRADGIDLYNGRPTGTGSVIHTEETRIKLSLAARKNFANRTNEPFVWTTEGRMWPKTCLWCDLDFNAKKKSTKYCSLKCSNLFNVWGSQDAVPNKETLESLYESGETLAAIGKIFGVSLVTIHNLMENYNIPRRTLGRPKK